MRSATPGNQEQIIIERPQQGRFYLYLLTCCFCYQVVISTQFHVRTVIPTCRYYIVLYGYEDYRDVGFEAESR